MSRVCYKASVARISIPNLSTDKIPHDVPQILINMEALPHMSGFDVQLLGYCDSVVTELCRLLDWNLEHPKIPGSSSLAAPQESEDAQGTVSRPPVYRPGSLPHRYLFEGGLERPVFDSDVSSVCSSSDGSSSDDGRDSCLDDEEDEDEQQSVVQEDSLDVQSKTEGSSREDDGHRKGYDADQEDLNPEATLSATSAAESPSLTSIDGESSMVEDPSLDQEAPGSLVQSE